MADQLTPAQQDEALRKIQDVKIKESSTPGYVDDVKHSLLFRPGFNWDDNLSEAGSATER
ncbi:hypothetical protein QBC47DRAFT_400095 [Echria macrotheca]|uniref:Uncharacterized protein n=1 Tax=Echria macrotheca TaxID=438768 RepID=A0AAJ0BJ17_9PEZI|nr:hypothetical protein QBC47DRAFT_400095 [Echria macrotheca]